MKLFYVYKHTNKINCKCYIGITQQLPEKRWKANGLGYQTQGKFYNAIQKYGWDNFEHEVLAEGLSQEEACKLEQTLIEKFDSINNGYNSSEGGIGCLGHIVTDEARLKMSLAKKGKPHGPCPEATRKKISEAKKGKPAVNISWNKGRKCSEEEKILIRQRAKDAAMRVVAKKVKCIELDQVYDSLTLAEEATGVANCNISMCASGKRKTAGKMHWVYV